MRTLRGHRRPHPEVQPEAYLLFGWVFGVLWFVLLLALYLIGLATRFIPSAAAIVVTTHMLLRPIGRFERYLVRRLLGVEIPAPAPIGYEQARGTRWSWLLTLWRIGLAIIQDGHSWRVLAWTFVRFVVGPFAFVLVLVRTVVPAPPLKRAAARLADRELRLAYWALGPGPGEITAAALARASQAEEQIRIDQELHDSIGHMLSMIVVQAGAGAHVFDRDPEFARSALGTIERRGRAALGELDRIIGNLQGTAGGGHDPLPGSDDLPALVEGAREAGMDVTARIVVEPLPPASGRGVYRIVQEALTNAATHAPGRPVRVDVVSGRRVVAVSVVNGLAGVPPRPDGTGLGLASIRDRAALLGGEATVGRTPAGEFAVRAVLPVDASLPAAAIARCALTPECACIGCAVRRSVPG